MANRDGTGPRGLGPMTGRGLGPCRFRSANEPFRGRLNQDDLMPLLKQAVREVLQEGK